ncbi:WD repeat-containing protein 44 [Aphelenchoides fujianensis]|nr:WD repeat-containing protein 44 [Aphelenchoides fujianensis]
MQKSESDDEFQDAVERLDSLPPHARVFPPNLPMDAPHTPTFPKTETHSRRGRLALVRSRMRSEFGLSGGNFGGSQASVDDVSQSDCTSMSSWGRKLLLETGNDLPPVACPADTLSTRASVSQWVESVPGRPLASARRVHAAAVARRPGHEPPTSAAPPPPRRTPLDAVQENETPPPPKVASVASPKRNHASTSSYPSKWKRKNAYAKKRGHAKTKSLDRGLSLAKAMKCGPFPPPASSTKSSSLNRGVSPSIVNACEEDEREDDAHGVIQQLTRSILSHSDGTDDEDSTASSSSSDEPHKKVSEESLKAAANEAVARTQARTHNSTPKYPSHDANRDLPVVGEESSTTSSTPVRSEQNRDGGDLQREAGGSSLFAQALRFVCVDRESIAATASTSGFKECRSASALHECVETPTSRLFVHHEAASPSRKRLLTHTHSIDPITQDVERRMSVKDHYSTRSSSHSGDVSREQSMHSIHSTIGSARAWVRSQATMAQTFIRGAYQKARTAVASGSTPKCGSLVGKDEDEVLESDAASSSVSMSASESNVKSYGRTVDGYPELNNEHTGAVWCVKFSHCGRLLATAGHDNLVRVWVLRNHLADFIRLRDKYNQQSGNSAGVTHDFERIHMQMEKKSSIGGYEDDASSICSRKSPLDSSASTKSCSTQAQSQNTGTSSSRSNYGAVFAPKPFSVFRGHTADVLDLSWSPKNFFLSLLRHGPHRPALPPDPLRDDRYFISGSLDGKIRLWNISEKKVTLWNEVDQTQFVTAICVSRKFIFVGTYDGRCFFYTTEALRYYTVLNVRSSRGKRGFKISSLAVHKEDFLLITSNDSRIRMYSISKQELVRKFKGAQIERSQIRASYSPNADYVICGSEDNFAYVWPVVDPNTALSLHNVAYERIRAHSSVVTAAIFAPQPQLFFSLLNENPLQLAPVVTTAYAKRFTRTSRLEPAAARPVDVARMADDSSVKSQSKSSRLFSAASARVSRVVDDFRHPRRSFLGFRTNGSVKTSPVMGDIIVTADQNGSIKIMANPRQLTSSQSGFADR